MEPLSVEARHAELESRGRYPRCCCPLVCLSTVLLGAMALLLPLSAGNTGFDVPPDAEAVGWNASGKAAGGDHWCSSGAPEAGWHVRENGCGDSARDVYVKVLTYNLYWWNLFGKRNGNGGSAGHLIAKAGSSTPFDLMAFQECDDVERILEDADAIDFEPIHGVHAVASAYRKSVWELLARGMPDVAEDTQAQYYGKRGVLWVRLEHRETGRTVFFMNHHGPLPVNSGGVCGTKATVYNLLRIIGWHAHPNDAIILVGDFNADAHSSTVRELSRYLLHVYTGRSFNGVDNFFTSCDVSLDEQNLGNGGSDHEALSITVRLGSKFAAVGAQGVHDAAELLNRSNVPRVQHVAV